MTALGERLELAAGSRVAHKWIAAMEQAILSLGDNPWLGAESDLLGKGRRRLVLRPYLIVYRIVEPDTVLIVRVVDGRRHLPSIGFAGED